MGCGGGRGVAEDGGRREAFVIPISRDLGAVAKEKTRNLLPANLHAARGTFGSHVSTVLKGRGKG